MEHFFHLSETRLCKAIFPGLLNANNSLFGGQAMQWMDEVAYISATRFTHQRMFTLNTDNIKFLKAVPENSIIEVIGVVKKADAVRLTIQVDIYAEDMYSAERFKAITGSFIMVSLNSQNKPQRIDYSYVDSLQLA